MHQMNNASERPAKDICGSVWIWRGTELDNTVEAKM